MKKFLIILFTLMIAVAAYATLDPSANNARSTLHNGYQWGGHNIKDKATKWAQAVEDSLDGTLANDNLLFSERTSDPTSTDGRLYFNTTSNVFKFFNGSQWLGLAAESGTVSLDVAYNNGNAIDVDGSAVTMTVGSGDNNAVLSLAQDDASNDPDGLLITMATSSDGNAINITGPTAGTDINADNWSILNTGLISTALDITFTEPTTNDVTLNADADAQLTIAGTSKEDFDINLATSNTVWFGSSTGAVTWDFGEFTTLIGSEDGDMTIQHTADTAGEDLIINQAGSGDFSVIINSAGTSAAAIDLTTATGGILLSAKNDIILSCASTGAADNITIQQTGAVDAGVDILVAGTATNAILLSASAGGITLTATGAASGDVVITTVDDFSLVATDDITIDGNSAGSIITIGGNNDGNVMNIGVDDTAADAITIGSVKDTIVIDGIAVTLGDTTTTAATIIQSGTGDVTITSTDDISMTVNTTTSDNIIITNTPGTGEDAINIDATAGGIDIDFATAKNMAIDGGQFIFTSNEAVAGAFTVTLATGAAETMVLTNTSGTDEAAINIDATAGGIDIDFATAKNMAVTGGQFIFTSNEAVASAFSVITNTGGAETITLVNTQGTGAGAITLTASAGALDFNAVGAEAGDITIDAGDNITITSAGDTTIANTGTFVVNGASTLTGAVTCTAGVQMGAVSRQPTVDGTGTGTVATGTSFVTIVDPTQATDYMILPACVAGTIVWMGTVDDAAGFEVRSSAPASITINGASGANFESAIPAGASLLRFVAVSSNDWIGTMFDADGDEAKIPAPNDD